MFTIVKSRNGNGTEPVFLNVYGAKKSIPRNEFRQPSLAGRYPIPTRFLDPIDCLKFRHWLKVKYIPPPLTLPEATALTRGKQL